MSRGGFKIQRNGYEYERSEPGPSWLSRFADEFAQKQRTAVEVMRERKSEPSIFDRITSIMGGGKTSPYSSVDEAVADYQKRTGLVEYHKQAMVQEILKAGEEEEYEEKKNSKPDLLLKNPAIETYIYNTIDTQPGIQLPAILYGIHETFGREGVRETDLDSPDLAKYISNMMKSRHTPHHDSNDSNIGRGIGTDNTNIYEFNDPNRDPFSGLMPKRIF